MTTDRITEQYVKLANDIKDQEQKDQASSLSSQDPIKFHQQHPTTNSLQSAPRFGRSYFFAIVETALALLPLSILYLSRQSSEVTLNGYFLLAFGCLYAGVAGGIFTRFAQANYNQGKKERAETLHALANVHLVLGGIVESIIVLLPACLLILLIIIFS